MTEIDRAKAYADTRARITELVGGLDETRAATTVPGCPQWTVKDVVAHVTGVCADILAGNLDGVASDAWTDAQVEARRDKPVDEILAEWSEIGPQVEGMLGAFPVAPASQLVTDLVTHEHDLRAALGAPGAHDSEAVAIGLEYAVRGFLASRPADAPPVKVVTGDRAWGDDGGARVAGEPFDLLRSFSGRRSESQIKGLQWDGNPAPHLPHFTFGPFSLPESDLPD